MRIKAHIHWQFQRLSAIILLVVLPLLIWVFYQLKGAEHANALAVIKHPVNFTVVSLAVLISFLHGFLGLQVIILDYAKGIWHKVATVILYSMTFIVLLVTFISLVGIVLK